MKTPPHPVRLPCGIFCLFLLLFGLMNAGAVVITFDTSTVLGANFNQTGTGAAGFSSSAGVGGGGTVVAASSYITYTYKGTDPTFTNGSVSLGVGDSISVSMYFKYTPVASGGRAQARNAGVYLGTTSTANPITAPTGTTLSTFFYDVNDLSSSTNTSFQYATFDTAGTPGGANSNGTSFTGTTANSGWWNSTTYNNDWLKVTTTFTKTSTSNLWAVSSVIANYGTSGTSFVGNIATVSANVTDSTLYSASSIYVGFQDYNISRGFNDMDTFEASVTRAVPEASPLMMGMLGLLGVVLCKVRKMRRSVSYWKE